MLFTVLYGRENYLLFLREKRRFGGRGSGVRKVFASRTEEVTFGGQD